MGSFADVAAEQEKPGAVLAPGVGRRASVLNTKHPQER